MFLGLQEPRDTYFKPHTPSDTNLSEVPPNWLVVDGRPGQCKGEAPRHHHHDSPHLEFQNTTINLTLTSTFHHIYIKIHVLRE